MPWYIWPPAGELRVNHDVVPHSTVLGSVRIFVSASFTDHAGRGR